jgi:GTP1/Obg family GTP-binding protein
MFNDRPKLQYLTWRMARNCIYMYDCGENYATVYNLGSQKELFDKIKNSFNNNTKEIKIKYKDDTKEIIHF